LNNLRIIYSSLQNINNALNGKLKSIIGSATFKMGEYTPPSDCPLCIYGGWTSGTTVTFYTIGNAAIRQMNIYHEFGHLIDSLPGSMYDAFTNALLGEGSPSYIINGYLNPDALINLSIKNDPNYAKVQAIQASGPGVNEQWADIFANYVAGNIDRSDPSGPGMAMYTFVTSALAPYIGVP